jgi:hypothetical protein
MTPDLTRTLDEYRAGVERQILLLEELAGLARAQFEACQQHDVEALARASAGRRRVMDTLLRLEREQRRLRDRVVENLTAARQLRPFDAVTRLHRQAERWLAVVDEHDRELRQRLEQGDPARRAAAHALEAGGATLAAYRKTLSYATPRSLIFDQHG